MLQKSIRFITPSIFLLFFLCITASLFGQELPITPDIEEMALKGNVHRITETMYDISQNKSKTLLESKKYMFNPNGNTAYVATYNRNDEPKWRYEYSYKKLGNNELPTQRLYYSFNTIVSKRLESKLQYAYTTNPSNKNQLKSRTITSFYGKKLSSKDKEIYNARNLPVSYISIQQEAGNSGAKTTFAYDARGNKIAEKYYFENGELSYHRKYSYNAKNQMVKYEYFKKEKLWSSYTQEFNSQGDVV
jgi:hypothetical protein